MVCESSRCVAYVQRAGFDSDKRQHALEHNVFARTAVPLVANLYSVNYPALGLATADNHATLLLLYDIGAITIASFLVLRILAALKHHFIDTIHRQHSGNTRESWFWDRSF